VNVADSALPVALTIAGSDSGGGAGIQADLKTFTALGVFGTSAITCLTAQNPDGVNGIHPVPPGMVSGQVKAVCDGFPVAAAKTGMLYDAAIIEAVAVCVVELGISNLVVDPVMVATSGARLLRDDAIRALCDRLLARATVITPNIPEASVLLDDRPIGSVEAQSDAAQRIAERYGTACVVKGGHLQDGGGIVNVLAAGDTVEAFECERVAALETHGTGCTFSAAVAALLARGRSLPDAVRGAGDYVAAALKAARPAGKHHVMVPAAVQA